MDETNTQQPLVFQVFEEPLVQALHETDNRPTVRNETFHWDTFVRVVVYYFVAGITSGRLLLTHLAHADPALKLPNDLKRSTFFEAFRRFEPQRSRELFHHLLSRLAFFPVTEMAALGILCAVDGSHWPALWRMQWAALTTNKPTVLLHLAFGLNQMLPVSMFLTPSNASERSVLRKLIEPGITYIADRGYFAFYLLHDIVRRGAFFVIRAPKNVRYTVVENFPGAVPQGLSWLFDVTDAKVECEGDDPKGTWRLVQFRIGSSWFLLFTNRWDLTTWQILTIYAYRWQIELFFLFAKRKLGGLHLLTESQHGMENQFYLLLISALLLLHFKQRNEAALNPDQVPQGEAVPFGWEETSEPMTVGPEPLSSEPLSSEPLSSEPLSSEPLSSEPLFPESSSRGPECSPEPRVTNPEPGRGTQTEPSLSRSEGRSEQRACANAGTLDPVPKEFPKSKLPRPEAMKSGTEATSSANPQCRGGREGTILDQDNASWYRMLTKKLHKFWRISVHWLQVLRDNLTNVWDPAVFQLTPGLQNAKQ